MAQFTLTSTDTCPRSSVLTGSATSNPASRVITGSGTSWLAEVEGGDWLYDAAGDQIRQVDFVTSDTEIILKTAFASAINNAAIAVAKGNKRQISIAASGGDIEIVDHFDNSSTIADGSSLTPLGDTRDAVAAIIVKATSAASAYCSTTP